MERNKPGPRSRQGDEIDKRINRLEAMLHVLGNRVEDHIRDHGDDQSEVRLSPGDYRLTPRPSPAISDARSLAHSRSGASVDIVDTGDPDLPPYELLYNLVDLYFKHVNTWCPILDRNTIVETLVEGAPTEPDRILLHAMVVASLRFMPRLEHARQYEISKQKVQLYGLAHANVRSLQALVIISLDAVGAPDGPSWNILALVARKITQLGLGVEKTFSLPDAALPQPKSWIEDEERRRLFWMVYILDRYATIGTSLEFVLDEAKTDRSLPCRYDLFSENRPVETRWFREGRMINKPENLGSFSYHCEVLRILSRVHKWLNTPVDINNPVEVERWQKTYWDLDGELDSWLFHLPDEYGKISQFCHSDPNSKISNWIILHAAYVTTAIRLHSAAAYPSVHSHIFKPSFRAMQRCLAAVVSLREIVLDVVRTEMLDLLGPAFALSLWTAARLLIVHASVGHELDPNIGFLVSILDQMGQHWPVARKYTETLNQLMGAQKRSDTFAGMRRSVTKVRIVYALR